MTAEVILHGVGNIKYELASIPSFFDIWDSCSWRDVQSGKIGKIVFLEGKGMVLTFLEGTHTYKTLLALPT